MSDWGSERKRKRKRLLCNRYEIQDLIRRGVTGYIYNGLDHGVRAQGGGGPVEVVLKLEARDAPKKQFHNEWKIYAKWEGRCIQVQAY